MGRINLRITRQELQVFLRLLPFFIPLGLTSASSVFLLLWYLYLGITMGLSLLEMWSFKKEKSHGEVIFLALFLGLYVLAQCYTTINYGGNWIFTLLKAFYIVFLCFCIQTSINREFNITLRVLDFILLCSILISTVSELVGAFNPNGEYVSVYISLPVWLTIRIVKNIQNGDKMDVWPLIISMFSVITTIVHAENGIYGDKSYEWTFFVELIVICGAYYCRKALYYVKRWCNPTLLFGSIIVLNLMVVVFQVFSQIGFIRFILVDVMHKDITFTGRTGIWGLAMSLIVKNPIWGYGENLVGYVGDGSYWSDFIRFHGAHNQFLEIMLFGGAVSLVFYILAFLKVWKSLHSTTNVITMFVTIGLFAILLELTFVYRQILMCTPMFVLMVIAVNMKSVYGGECKGVKNS